MPPCPACSSSLLYVSQHILVVVDGDAVDFYWQDEVERVAGVCGSKGPEADRLVAHVCVQRHGVLPCLRHARTSELSLDVGLAIGSSLDRRKETVLWDSRTADILVEEPIHLMIAVDIHTASHVLFHDGLEVLGGACLAVSGHTILLHHVLRT